MGNTPIYKECKSIEEVVLEINKEYNWNFDSYYVSCLDENCSPSQYIHGKYTKDMLHGYFSKDINRYVYPFPKSRYIKMLK